MSCDFLERSPHCFVSVWGGGGWEGGGGVGVGWLVGVRVNVCAHV